MANNESHLSSRGKPSKLAGVHKVDCDNTFSAKVEALTLKIDLLMGRSLSSRTVMFYETCGGGHKASESLISSSSVIPME